MESTQSMINRLKAAVLELNLAYNEAVENGLTVNIYPDKFRALETGEMFKMEITETRVLYRNEKDGKKVKDTSAAGVKVS